MSPLHLSKTGNFLQTGPDHNTTTSVVTYLPSVDDEGKYITCKAQQPLVTNSFVQDEWKLEIYRKWKCTSVFDLRNCLKLLAPAIAPSRSQSFVE